MNNFKSFLFICVQQQQKESGIGLGVFFRNSWYYRSWSSKNKSLPTQKKCPETVQSLRFLMSWRKWSIKRRTSKSSFVDHFLFWNVLRPWITDLTIESRKTNTSRVCANWNELPRVDRCCTLFNSGVADTHQKPPFGFSRQNLLPRPRAVENNSFFGLDTSLPTRDLYWQSARAISFHLLLLESAGRFQSCLFIQIILIWFK